VKRIISFYTNICGHTAYFTPESFFKVQQLQQLHRIILALFLNVAMFVDSMRETVDFVTTRGFEVDFRVNG